MSSLSLLSPTKHTALLSEHWYFKISFVRNRSLLVDFYSRHTSLLNLAFNSNRAPDSRRVGNPTHTTAWVLPTHMLAGAHRNFIQQNWKVPLLLEMIFLSRVFDSGSIFYYCMRMDDLAYSPKSGRLKCKLTFIRYPMRRYKVAPLGFWLLLLH